MKKFMLMMLTILFCCEISNPVHANSQINAKAAIMIDASTGQIIYSQNANQQLPVASISKLLTVAVIHDELQRKDITDYTKVNISPDIATISNDPEYSSVGLVSGHSYPVIELLNAAMVKSADGATLALAMASGSSIEEFVITLNQKAHQLGMKHTKIVNPVGLTNGQLKNLSIPSISTNAENEMSANDVALLARYLVNTYPSLLQVTSQKKANIMISKGNVKSVGNLNKMLPGDKYTVPGVTINGLKTGTSDKAGACFVSSGKYDGHQIITVVLHANGDNDDARFIQTQKLYEMLKSNYHLYNISLPQDVTDSKIDQGTQRTIKTSPTKLSVWSNSKIDSYTVAQDFNNNLVNRNQTLQAPIKKGERIGNIRLTSSQLKTVSGEPLTFPLYSNQSVNKGNFVTQLFH